MIRKRRIRHQEAAPATTEPEVTHPVLDDPNFDLHFANIKQILTAPHVPESTRRAALSAKLDMVVDTIFPDPEADARSLALAAALDQAEVNPWGLPQVEKQANIDNAQKALDVWNQKRAETMRLQRPKAEALVLDKLDPNPVEENSHLNSELRKSFTALLDLDKESTASQDGLSGSKSSEVLPSPEPLRPVTNMGATALATTVQVA